MEEEFRIQKPEARMAVAPIESSKPVRNSFPSDMSDMSDMSDRSDRSDRSDQSFKSDGFPGSGDSHSGFWILNSGFLRYSLRPK